MSLVKGKSGCNTNPGQLGLGSSRPESARPGQLGLCNLIIEAAHVSFYSCVGTVSRFTETYRVVRHQYE